METKVTFHELKTLLQQIDSGKSITKLKIKRAIKMKFNHWLIIIGVGVISYSYMSLDSRPTPYRRNQAAIYTSFGSMLIAAGVLRQRAS